MEYHSSLERGLHKVAISFLTIMLRILMSTDGDNGLAQNQ